MFRTGSLDLMAVVSLRGGREGQPDRDIQSVVERERESEGENEGGGVKRRGEHRRGVCIVSVCAGGPISCEVNQMYLRNNKLDRLQNKSNIGIKPKEQFRKQIRFGNRFTMVSTHIACKILSNRHISQLNKLSRSKSKVK